MKTKGGQSKMKRISIKNARISIKNWRISIKNERVSIKNRRISIKNERVSIKIKGFFIEKLIFRGRSEIRGPGSSRNSNFLKGFSIKNWFLEVAPRSEVRSSQNSNFLKGFLLKKLLFGGRSEIRGPGSSKIN